MANRKKFKLLIRRKLNILFILMMTTIFALSLIIFINNNGSKEQLKMINEFGRQRMLIQTIAKDSNQKYQTLQELQVNFLGIKDRLESNINTINDSLNNAQQGFNITLSSLKIEEDKSNNLSNEIKEIVKQIDESWKMFSEAIVIIVESENIDPITIEALNYINKNSYDLLSKSDLLVQKMLENNNTRINRNTNIIIAMVVCFTIIILLFLKSLLINIIIPLDKLFTEINKISILKKGVTKTRFAKNEVMPIISEIDEGFKKLNKLIDLIENINQSISFDDVLDYIYNSFSSFIPYQHIGIALLNEEKQELQASYGISEPMLQNLPIKLLGIKAKLSNTSLENIIRDGTPRIINDLESYVKGKTTNYNKVLLEEGIKSSITLPLTYNKRAIGIIFFSSIHKNVYKEEHVDFLKAITNSIAISFNDSIFIEELIYSSTLALAKMAESRDEDTGEHLDRMKIYTRLIADYLVEDGMYLDELTVTYIKDLERFAPMHDIGKVGVPDGILLKPGKLTDDEFAEMKKHTIYGGEILRVAEENILKQNISLYKVGIEISECHHEKWDGSGYPHRLTGKTIPLSARIVALADVFDALTSKRVYKEAFSFEKAVEIVQDSRGKHFDPDIVDVFIKHKDEIYQVYKSFNQSYIS